MHGNSKAFSFDKDDVIYSNVGTTGNYSRYPNVSWQHEDGDEETTSFNNLLGRAIQKNFNLEGDFVTDDEKDEVQTVEADEDM